MKRLYLILIGFFAVFLLSQCGDGSSSSVLNATVHHRISSNSSSIYHSSGHLSSIRPHNNDGYDGSYSRDGQDVGNDIRRKSVIKRIFKHSGKLFHSSARYYGYDGYSPTNTTYVVMLLENGDIFTFFPCNKCTHKFNCLLLEKGDTIVYNQHEILDIYWKE